MAKDEILGEIHNLKSEFTGRFDGVLKAIEETRKEVTECTERMAGAEVRLSNVEDEQVDLKTVVESLQTRNKHLEDKVVDMETRLRLNNLRLVGLPENSEGFDMCGFLESWLPDALELNPMRHPLVLERAHRIGPKRDTNTSPRTVIMRFLNYKQKEIVLRTAKTKKDIFYKNQRVKLFADVAMEVHRQRKQFDVVRDQLRKLGVRHGILSPATLVLTYKEKVHKFTSPVEAKIFTQKIQMEMVETE
ncbi:LINE-1 type transposase domain-containing protein 1 [Labeo rohita]|uniref:LINE-1 type transposase domain-containing protein 1 n=1 Tax=Labeo rohita TaxID=84645 RepID=A0ABQ8L6U3_LABRO|nr:LINE-1 type transposase domain-containing protein 1 [Labeo rohita]